MTKKSIVIVAVMGVLFFSSCSYNKEQAIPNSNTCGPTPASFSVDIKDLIATNCAKPCHNTITRAGDKVFEDYAQIKANIVRIRQRAIVERTMPQFGSPFNPLSQSDYDKLKCWIDRGALND